MSVDNRDLFPHGKKPSGAMDGKIFMDAQGTKWFVKSTDCGCFLRLQGNPGGIDRTSWRWKESDDKLTHQNISAIWEVLFNDLFSQITGGLAAEARVYRNVPSPENKDTQPELLVASREIPNFQSLEKRINNGESFAGKKIEGFSMVVAASYFIADVDIANVDNIGMIEQPDGGIKAMRVDFGFGGWFSTWKEFNIDSVPRMIAEVDTAHYQLATKFNNIVPFKESIIPENDTRQALEKICSVDPSIFETTWAKYKDLLLTEANKLQNNEERKAITHLVENDLPVRILKERQEELRHEISGKCAAPNYTNCTNIEDNLYYERTMLEREAQKKERTEPSRVESHVEEIQLARGSKISPDMVLPFG